VVDPVLAVVADDLSGAAESAAHALVRVSRSLVRLSVTSTPATNPTGRVVVSLDTDSRSGSAQAAADAVRAAAAEVRDVRVVVKKVDSLLRGHVGIEVEALSVALSRRPVVALANPSLGRHVRGGVVHVDGTPLHRTVLWALEGVSPPVDFARALAPLACVVIPLATVRSGLQPLAAQLRDAWDRSLVAVCDGETDADLDAVVAAARSDDDLPLLVGSGALVDAVVRTLDSEAPHPRGNAPAVPITQPPVGSLLAVLGSRAPLVAAQVEQARTCAAATVLLDPADLLAGAEAVAGLLDRLPSTGLVVVALDPAAEVDHTRSRDLAAALAAAVRPVTDRYDATFLAGGETARAVLDGLGVTELDVVATLDHGTVLSRRPDGRLVVTRPGSFGDAQSLTLVAQRLLHGAAPLHTSDTHPTRQASPTTEENS
jgi:uncharacterized protein YgbK (DUF1537 family)